MARALLRDGDNQIVVSETHPTLIAVSWTCATRLKMIVSHMADVPLYYDIPNDGTKTVVPLCNGNGRYRIDLVRSLSGAWATVADVSLRVEASGDDAMRGYLARSGWCNWSKDGPCAMAARAMVTDGKAPTKETVDRVIAHMRKSVTYDKAKAERLRGGHGYVPNPDRTLADGSGICSDIASATCAILRCAGVPSRMVAGYVLPKKVSHAWVESFVDGRWVTFDPTSLMGTTKRASKSSNKYQAVCRW